MIKIYFMQLNMEAKLENMSRCWLLIKSLQKLPLCCVDKDDIAIRCLMHPPDIRRWRHIHEHLLQNE